MDPELVVWVHSACSMDSLRSVFVEGSKINAIEVDITWNSIHQLSVMKHSAESKEHDLGNEVLASDWFSELFNVLLPSRAPSHFILKLDFKHSLSVLPVIEMISRSFSMSSEEQQKEGEQPWFHPSSFSSKFAKTDQIKAKFEIWLNADILRGPGAVVDALGLNPHQFLQNCKILPHAALSLGWTTGFDHFSLFNSKDDKLYEHCYVDAMLAICNDPSLVHPMQELTFPIRASLARESWHELERLVNLNSYTNPNRPQPSITLWTGVEGVPENDLIWFHQLSKEKKIPIYVDCDKGSKAGWYSFSRIMENIKDGMNHFLS